MVEEDRVKAFDNAFLAVRTEKYIQKECEMQGMCEGLLPRVQQGRSVAQLEML